MKMKKIAMILHTDGIEYDDRIRKEMLTVMKLYPDIKFKIFAIIDGDSNVEEQGVSDYGVEYVIPVLKSRNKYKPGTHLLAKAYDFYKTITPMVKDYDAIWVANERVVFFVALSRKPIIWDWHEILSEFLGSSIKKSILKFLMSRCKAVIHANPQRIDYIDSIGGLSNKNRQFAIRNFPNFNDADKETDAKYHEFITWLGDSNCVYLQGAENRARCDEESIEGILAIENLKAVVVGRFNQDLKNRLLDKYGEELSKRLFFTGMVRQKMTPHYIRACKVSLVLYKNVRPNNFYCEPNRMFQSIINDCPVVVGCNPPMKELVEKYNFGVVLPSDGSNVEEITAGLNQVLIQRDNYLESLRVNKNNILWDSQEDEFKRIIEATFSNKRQ